ncbi:pilus assembly protein TadG-related protein [Streptomyces sp. SS]|uniref:pilus assembly protein TadG-related protein n=1 Tax=Streptomyces sp. SS TaxID=260742 RepID=UPI00030172F6|nr:pilus assembly protein TadG-related protein [Streptomyces sp. SS]
MLGARRGDSGQAFPVYMAAISGLLFLAFVYFAVGQAVSTRNGAQTAADAAALAAAQDAREQLRTGWLEVLADPVQWGKFLEGRAYDDLSACQAAAAFASRNGAELSGDRCTRLPLGSEGFAVTVTTTGTVGRSIVPGTETQHVTASARAVIEPKCSYVAQQEPTTDPTPTEPGEDEGQDGEPILGLTCDDEPWDIDPEAPTLPRAVDLFTVRLIGDNE